MSRQPAAAGIRLSGFAACLAAAVLVGCGADERDDVARNRAILNQLPQFPGTRPPETTSAPYYGEEMGPFTKVTGHTTNVVYAAPHGASAGAIVGFYASRLKPPWRCRRESERILDLDRPSPRRGERASILHVHCTRGQAAVSVNTDNMPASFEVAVDWRGARSGRN